MFFIFLVLMFSEADTRSKFTDPKLYAQDWKEEYIVREWFVWCLDLSELRRSHENESRKSKASAWSGTFEKNRKSDCKILFGVFAGVLSSVWKYGTGAVQDGRVDQALWSWIDQYCRFYQSIWWSGAFDASVEGVAEGVI